MNSIELTDIDGDALTIITRGTATWITSTSGCDEVTVGPFPAQLFRSAIQQGDEALASDLHAPFIASIDAGDRAGHLVAMG